MKIAFVIGKLANRSGGAERVLKDIADGLASLGHIVTVYSYSPGLEGDGFYPFIPAVTHINLGLKPPRLIQLIKSKIGSNLSPKGNAFPGETVRDRAYIWRKSHFSDSLGEKICLDRPDVIVGFMGDGVCVVAEVLRRLNVKIPFLASIHSTPVRLFGKSGSKERLTQKAMSSATGVGFPLSEHRQYLSAEARNRFKTYPNPVHFPETKPNWKRKKRVLCVGRLVSLKRLNLLIEAWGSLSEQYDDWTLEFFGSGPELSKLQSQANSIPNSESILFHGDVVDICKEYQSASILAHPSKYEGFGLVLAEALGHGVPVVGYDNVPGVQSLIQDGCNGLLVTPNGDVDALSRCLEMLMANPDRLQSYSNASWDSIQEYSYDQVIETWNSQLEQLVLGN